MKNLSEVSKSWDRFVIRDAIVGVSGIKKVLFQVYNTLIRGKAHAFENEEDAIAWLVDQSR